MKKNVLVIGDSQTDSIERLRQHLEELYDINLYVRTRSGATLLDIGQALNKIYRRERVRFDFIYIFGLTCFMWSKEKIHEIDAHFNFITWNPACNLSLMPATIDAIVHEAQAHYKEVKVFLMIPPIRDIATLNEQHLKVQKRKDLLDAVRQHPLLSRQALSEKARLLYQESLHLMDRKCYWKGKRTFSLASVFDNYYQDEVNPHEEFFSGLTDRLLASDMTYDGLHYTEPFVKLLFEMLSPYWSSTSAQRPARVSSPETESVSSPPATRDRLEFTSESRRALKFSPITAPTPSSSSPTFSSKAVDAPEQSSRPQAQAPSVSSSPRAKGNVKSRLYDSRVYVNPSYAHLQPTIGSTLQLTQLSSHEASDARQSERSDEQRRGHKRSYSEASTSRNAPHSSKKRSKAGLRYQTARNATRSQLRKEANKLSKKEKRQRANTSTSTATTTTTVTPTTSTTTMVSTPSTSAAPFSGIEAVCAEAGLAVARYSRMAQRQNVSIERALEIFISVYQQFHRNA